MYADAVTTVVLEVQSNPKAQKGWNMKLLTSILVFYLYFYEYQKLNY